MGIIYQRNDGLWCKYLGSICITKFEEIAEEKGYKDYDTIELKSVTKTLRNLNKNATRKG